MELGTVVFPEMSNVQSKCPVLSGRLVLEETQN